MNERRVVMAVGSPGNCYICGTESTPRTMKNHLLKMHNVGDEECCLLRVEGVYDNNYWFFIDLPIKSTLKVVDDFLRKIWLECCEHMSRFRTSGRNPTTRINQSEVSMNRKLSVLSPGDRLVHEYDFGDTTESLVTVMGPIKRKKQKEPVRLLARNIPTRYTCSVCGETAECICKECEYEKSDPFLCDACAEEHNHDDLLLLPITNSPRFGICGYCGERDVFGFDPGSV